MAAKKKEEKPSNKKILEKYIDGDIKKDVRQHMKREIPITPHGGGIRG
jgi:hypothetical protein